MTIDDFDVNEISDKLSIREETDNSHTLQAGHDDNVLHNDGHDDTGTCPHDDTVNGPSHNDHTCGHNDGHDDLNPHDDHDDACFHVFNCT